MADSVPDFLSKEELSFLRFCHLILKVAPQAVRHRFDQEFPPSALEGIIQSKMSVLEDLNRRKVFTRHQWQLICSTGSSHLSRQFDFTLMISLFRNLSNVLPMSGQFDTLPPPSDTTLGGDLARIKYYRNYMSHCLEKERKLSNHDFPIVWKEASEAIGRLGGQQYVQECDRILFTNLDGSDIDTLKEFLNVINMGKDLKLKRKDLIPDNIQGETQEIIPEKIGLMNNESIERYIRMLEKGREKKRDIRVVVVGKQGSGKSSFVKRIFKEEISNVLSTNGIEIHKRKCKVDLECDEWIKEQQTDVFFDIDSRLRRHLNDRSEKHANSTNISEENLSDLGQEKVELDDYQHEIMYERQTPEPVQANIYFSNETAREKLNHLLSKEFPEDNSQHASLTVWDFAGHKEFYNTHHVFLSPEAIYLVITRLDETATKVEDTIRFWFDSIHYYGSRNDNSDVETLNPPVIAIGTFKDKCETPKFEEKLEKQIRMSLGSSVCGRHLKSRYYVSNTNDEDDVFDQIRKEIIKIAKGLPAWEMELPVLFIELEKQLQIECETTKILSFDKLMKIGRDLKPVPLTDEKDLELFLRYHHDIGNLIFFTKCPDYIILDPQWLADALSCIISSYNFQRRHVNYMQWETYIKTGKLSNSLLSQLFSTQPKEIRDHREHVLRVMENFDLIVKPNLPEGKVAIDLYVPCVIQNDEAIDIEEKLSTPGTKTSCLCFEFNFLPPPLINHLFIACIRNFVISCYHDLDGEEFPALFKNMAVFDTDESGCEKLIVVTFQNTIQIQIWKYGSECLRQYTDIKNFIENTIKEIKERSFCQLNLYYTIRFKCSDTKYNCLKGVMDLNLYDRQYYCKEHNVPHVMKNEWFENSTPEERQNTEPSDTEQSEARSESSHLELSNRGLFPTPNNQPIPLEMNNAVLEGAVGYHWAVMNYRGQMQYMPLPNLPKIPYIDEPSYLDMSLGTDPYDKLFLKIGTKIVLDWKMVGRHLGLSEDNISIIESNYTKIEEKSYQMLRRWRSLRGNNASKADLIQALEACELRQVAKMVDGFVLEGENDQETTYMKAIEEGSG